MNNKPKQKQIPNYIEDLVKSGYAGILSGGGIVDRRKATNAIPLQKNEQLGIPEPKEINTGPKT